MPTQDFVLGRGRELGRPGTRRLHGAAGQAGAPTRGTRIHCRSGRLGSLRTRPKDLTQIAKENGGTFPFAKIVATIDGTNEVRAHGDPDMPVWGEVFSRSSASAITRRADVRGKLMLITQYVQSIQAK